MKIIIAGLGKIGWAAAEQLLAEQHDVAVIDISPERVEQAVTQLDLMAIEGNAASCETLQTAGADAADLLIASTASDTLNLVCCMVGQRLGARHTIARVRDTAYLRQADFMRESFGLSLLINPELEVASEISRILRFPTAIRIDSFSRGRVELAEYRLHAGSSLVGLPLSRLNTVYPKKVLICAVKRDNEVRIPKGDFVLRAGDRLSLAAGPEELRGFFKAAGVYKRAVRNVLMLGGGRISAYLARQLAECGIHTRIIERDEARCRELCELLPHTEIIHGDGTKRELLLEQGLDSADGFVALTGIDEENLILSMYVRSLGVGKIIAKVNEEHLAAMLEETGLECFVSPKQLVVEQIVRYVRALQNARGSNVETLYRLIGGRVEALEFMVKAASRCAGRPLKQLPVRSDVLVVAVTRDDRVLIPNGDTALQEGDRAVIISTQSGLKDVDDILTEKQ